MVHEIEITKFLANDRSHGCLDALEAKGVEARQAVFVADVLEAVQRASEDNVGVLLVVIGGPGGHLAAGFEVYEALREFSRAGGRVVTFAAAGRVASTAPFLLLAGDHVLAAQDASLHLHGIEGGTGEERAENEGRLRAMAAEHTVLPPKALDACLGRQGLNEDGSARTIWLSLAEATKNAWVDEVVADLEEARRFALGLADGSLSLPRRHEEGGSLPFLRRRNATRDQAFKLSKPQEPITCAVTADKIEANAIKTSNYASTGTSGTFSEVATAGAKMQKDGIALMVAPNGLKLGTAWFNDPYPIKGVIEITLNGGSYGVPTGVSAVRDATTQNSIWTNATLKVGGLPIGQMSTWRTTPEGVDQSLYWDLLLSIRPLTSNVGARQACTPYLVNWSARTLGNVSWFDYAYIGFGDYTQAFDPANLNCTLIITVFAQWR